MNNISSIKLSIAVFKKYKIPYALLHTTNLYPTPYKLVRLGAMNDLMKNFPSAIVGLSDHTDNNYASYGAIAMGASIIERHFTDNFKRKGPDIPCSMDIASCKELIKASQILFYERGGKKNTIKEEKVTSDFAFATVVSIEDIKKGDRFSYENLWVKRPGTGKIKASKFNTILNKKASRNIKKDAHLKLEDIKK
jgi:N-acetylneuraminate synthase